MNISRIRNQNHLLIICILILYALGLFALYSAAGSASAAQGRDYLSLQLRWIFIGIILIVAVNVIGYSRFLELAYPLYALNVILLLVVIFAAPARQNVHRWINILGFNIQPSELMKLSIILTLARFLSVYKYKEDLIKCVGISVMLVLVPILLIIKQPDLGTALLFIPLLIAMLYVWGMRLKYIILAFLAGLAASPLMWSFLKDYQKQRLLVFLNPNIDPLGSGYTIIQSKIAIGSGGLLGKGWLQGTQSQLNFLPEHHTDFIFSSIGEEWGLIGALLVIFLLFLVIWEGLNIAQRSLSMDKKLLAAGISVLIFLQATINICMTMGLMPVVGMPLPFISYGGSHIIVFSILIGLLININYSK